MSTSLIECVPNFSEGRDLEIIRQITDSIEGVKGVKLLNVDPGKAANRTVVTFVGPPEAVCEAAFLAIKTAGELIDMRRQKGEHPRMGATDVCPLIPIANITLEETVQFAQKLAARVGNELGIPVYLYEAAQLDKNRKDLSAIRAGEYEGFFNKILLAEWKPDYGPQLMDSRRGATVIGARDFLIAYNINLNTKEVRIAQKIAADVRESGREIHKDGKKFRQPGSLKNVKAIGWYIEEYGKAQVSMNLTNIKETPIHIVFEEVRNAALANGAIVTGSELIGLIPLKAMRDAGVFFLQRKGLNSNVSEEILIESAVETLGLGELSPFVPRKRIIEYQLVE